MLGNADFVVFADLWCPVKRRANDCWEPRFFGGVAGGEAGVVETVAAGGVIGCRWRDWLLAVWYFSDWNCFVTSLRPEGRERSGCGCLGVDTLIPATQDASQDAIRDVGSRLY